MKIALTQAHLEKSADFTKSYTIATLSAWIKKNKPSAEVYYAENVRELLDADEVLCTSTSEAWGKVNELGKIITEEGKRFVVGGHHATAFPESLSYGEAFAGPIEGCAYNINMLPFPDWSILPEDNNKRFILMTSRGCPFRCSFCSSAAFWKKYIPKSPARVIAEIMQLHTLSAKSICIFDDLFTADKNRLREIVKRIKSQGLDKVTYSCLVRSDSVDEETAALLAEMNVTEIAFGSESGSDKILQLMRKKTTVVQNLSVFKLFAAYGSRVSSTSLVLGHPGESPQTLEETEEYISLIRPFCANITIYPLIPFPGTPVWQLFCQKYQPDFKIFDWSSLAIDQDTFSWDSYRILSNECSLEILKDFYSRHNSTGDAEKNNGSAK